MTRDELRQLILETLSTVAPEAELGALTDDEPLRDQLDLDSVDHLRFVQALHERLGVGIPEVDYPKLGTLGACVAYLAKSTGAR